LPCTDTHIRVTLSNDEVYSEEKTQATRTSSSRHKSEGDTVNDLQSTITT